MNASSMDMASGLSVKDPAQSQSRLPQWTHPSSMDNLTSAASLDQSPSKHGTAWPAGLAAGRSCFPVRHLIARHPHSMPCQEFSAYC